MSVKKTTMPAVIGLSAYSGTGKTTLLKKLIPLLIERNIRTAVIKHAHHDFEVDHPGKDSFELRKANTCQLLISSSKRKALLTEFEEDQPEPTLYELIQDLDHDNIDLILVEGFKRECFRKIELYREALQKPFLYTKDSGIIAFATDNQALAPTHITALDINQPESIVDFITASIAQDYTDTFTKS